MWLDAGCGRAAYRPFVSGRYVGVDLVHPFLLDAKDRAPDGDFVAADIRHLPFADRTFDIVVASQVIEHLETSGLEQVLNEFRRVARRSIIVDTPNEARAISALRHRLYGDICSISRNLPSLITIGSLRGCSSTTDFVWKGASAM